MSKAVNKLATSVSDTTRKFVDAGGNLAEKLGEGGGKFVAGLGEGGGEFAAKAGKGGGEFVAGLGEGGGKFAAKAGYAGGELAAGLGEGGGKFVAKAGDAGGELVAGTGIATRAFIEQGGQTGAKILGKTGDLTVSGMQEIANTLSTMKDISKRTGEAISVRLNELEEDRLGYRSTQKETTSKLKDITGGKALDSVKAELTRRMNDRGKRVIDLLTSMKTALTNLVCKQQSIVKRYIFDKRCNPAFADSLVKTQKSIDLLIETCKMKFKIMLNQLVGANSVTIGEIYESQIALEATMMGKANTRFTEFTNAIEASLGLSETPVDSYGSNPPEMDSQEMDPASAGGRKRKRTKRKRKTRRTRRYIHSP